MKHCEECGKTGMPLIVVVFSLKKKNDPGTLYTESLYICKECLEKTNEYEPIPESRTIH